MKSVAVDFDGVLNTYTGWQGEDELFEPREGVTEFLDKLGQKYDVIIYTTRNSEKVQGWLEWFGLDHYVDEISNIKPKAIAYVDDRGVRFEGDYEAALSAIEQPAHWEL